MEDKLDAKIDNVDKYLSKMDSSLISFEEKNKIRTILFIVAFVGIGLFCQIVGEFLKKYVLGM